MNEKYFLKLEMLNNILKTLEVYTTRPFWAIFVLLGLTWLLTWPFVIILAIIVGIWTGIFIGETSSNVVGLTVSIAALIPAFFFANKLVIKYIKPNQ